jgi:hypothetical protein
MLLVLVVCVPIPAFALSGLAIPLPGVVERAAAALVPWAEAVPTLDAETLAASRVHGSIILAPDESPTAGTTASRPARPARRAPATRRVATTAGEAPAASHGGGVTRSAPEVTPTVPSQPQGDGGGSGSTAPAPAPTPAPTPAPAPKEPTGGAGHKPKTEGPVTPDVTPTGPIPGVDPKADPDVEPVDEPDVKPQPADDADVAPVDDPAESPKWDPADPAKPDEKPGADPGGPPRNEPRRGSDAREPELGP